MIPIYKKHLIQRHEVSIIKESHTQAFRCKAKKNKGTSKNSVLLVTSVVCITVG